MLANQLSRKQSLFFSALFIISVMGCSKGSDAPAAPAPPPPPPPPAKTWVVSTVAGNGAGGVLDGPVANASFKLPAFLTLDASGNIFVGDFLNNFIREIKNGQVTTFIGRNTPGIDPIFMGIAGIVMDKQNNLYDVESGFIRKITPAGTTSILAGSLEHTIKDGPDTSARFNEITGLVLGSDNNLYLTDLDFNSKTIIRKITPSGLVSTVAFNDNTGIASGSTNGQLVYYQPMVIDKTGNIFFTANQNTLIKKRDAGGNITVFAGGLQQGSNDGKGAAAQFNNITSMTIADDGAIYLIDQLINAVRKVGTDGTVTTLAGTNGPGWVDGDPSVARFKSPFGIIVDANGVLYIADQGNNLVRKMELK